MMIRKHLNPPRLDNKQVLEKKLVKILPKWTFSIFANLASAESWPSISALNGHFTQPPGKLITCIKNALV